jgi:hypothetical protein
MLILQNVYTKFRSSLRKQHNNLTKWVRYLFVINFHLILRRTGKENHVQMLILQNVNTKFRGSLRKRHNNINLSKWACVINFHFILRRTSKVNHVDTSI